MEIVIGHYKNLYWPISIMECQRCSPWHQPPWTKGKELFHAILPYKAPRCMEVAMELEPTKTTRCQLLEYPVFCMRFLKPNNACITLGESPEYTLPHIVMMTWFSEKWLLCNTIYRYLSNTTSHFPLNHDGWSKSSKWFVLRQWIKLMMSPKFQQVAFAGFSTSACEPQIHPKNIPLKNRTNQSQFFSEFHFALKTPQPHKKGWTNLSNNLNPTKNSHEISFRQPQPPPKNSPTLRMTPLLIEGVFGSQKRATKKSWQQKMPWLVLYTPINIGMIFFPVKPFKPTIATQLASRAETLKPAPSAVVVGSTGSSSSIKRSTYCRRAAASYNGEAQAAGALGEKRCLWPFLGGS